VRVIVYGKHVSYTCQTALRALYASEVETWGGVIGSVGIQID